MPRWCVAPRVTLVEGIVVRMLGGPSTRRYQAGLERWALPVAAVD